MNVYKYLWSIKCICVFCVIFCYVFSSCVFSSCWQVKKLFQVQSVDYTAVETDIVGKRCNEQANLYPGVMAFANVQINEDFLVGISLQSNNDWWGFFMNFAGYTVLYQVGLQASKIMIFIEIMLCIK